MASSDQTLATTVLFVDDERRILSALQRLTMDEDFSVITASSGEKALEILKKTPDIGLIVSDQQMPGMTGVVLLEKAKELAPDALRIILTGFSSINTAVDAINKGGAYRFISKPWNDEKLLLMLREGVERFRLIRENKRLTELVKKQHTELKEWNARLEQRVEEQTREIQGYVETLTQDLDEIKQMDEKLRKTNHQYIRLSEQFRALFDGIPAPLLLLSPELKVIWGNRGAGEIFELDPAGQTEKYCYDIWKGGGNRARCADCGALTSFRTGQTDNQKIKTEDGRVWEVRFFPIKDEHEKILNVIAMYVDITEKNAHQAETIRAGQLASLGELAAGVAHEINNPVNGVINYAQILSNRSAPESKENDIAQRIIKEGERIAVIVKSLLAFARDRKESKSFVPLQEILSETLVLVETQLLKSGIKLGLELSPNLPPAFVLKQQIQQVFLNLISNARYALDQKYPGAHDQKLLTIQGEACIVAKKAGLRITFHDHGIGIPENVLDKIMNPFFSTKPHDKGTGLGLSISHGIIDNHDGRMTINSVQGEFTRVIVELPAHQPVGVDK